MDEYSKHPIGPSGQRRCGIEKYTFVELGSEMRGPDDMRGKGGTRRLPAAFMMLHILNTNMVWIMQPGLNCVLADSIPGSEPHVVPNSREVSFCVV